MAVAVPGIYLIRFSSWRSSLLRMDADAACAQTGGRYEERARRPVVLCPGTSRWPNEGAARHSSRHRCEVIPISPVVLADFRAAKAQMVRTVRVAHGRVLGEWSAAWAARSRPTNVAGHLAVTPDRPVPGLLVSALAIMHSPRSTDFRWPTSRRRRSTPPRSRSSNRRKQETTPLSRFPQVDPSFPAGSGTRTSPSPPWGELLR